MKLVKSSVIKYLHWTERKEASRIKIDKCICGLLVIAGIVISGLGFGCVTASAHLSSKVASHKISSYPKAMRHTWYQHYKHSHKLYNKIKFTKHHLYWDHYVYGKLNHISEKMTVYKYTKDRSGWYGNQPVHNTGSGDSNMYRVTKHHGKTTLEHSNLYDGKPDSYYYLHK
ncbi:hypothetical protein IWT140_00153 [Secundilactobacillus pentosiphilus]|uniref:Uncharacterized protein n=1 Tax=Secundilactobacillus pentosiphilus TaxID=1714682 RepID=A0A1Z5ILJ0_9LACO|nr:hypothetical protein [Secundilactobacillus pentosiphilus]GAX02556.1 hypothetical protein IWT140_00153 [Secundilactobacillus pentosiphilus]